MNQIIQCFSGKGSIKAKTIINNIKSDVDNNPTFYGSLLGFLFAASLIGAGLIYQKWSIAKSDRQSASINAVATLSKCGDDAARKLLEKGALLTNGDLKRISMQCQAPANNIQDQVGALKHQAVDAPALIQR